MAYYRGIIKKDCTAFFDVSYSAVNILVYTILFDKSIFGIFNSNTVKNPHIESYYKCACVSFDCSEAVAFEFVDYSDGNNFIYALSRNNRLLWLLQLCTMGFRYY